MKKNSLTMAVVAGFAGAAGLANVATAVNLNPDGLGQVLIYPYYTVNGGNATILSVVNTTDEVKAVKVRFLEAKNSREVLDFNLYLSPFDVWTSAVVDNGGGTTAARLFTSDTSCTVPAIPSTGVDFRNFFYASGSANDDGEGDLGRTREGHIEMIEMGVVDETVTAATTNYEISAIHGFDPDGVGQGASAVPLNCARLVASWSGNLAANNWSTDGSIDVRGPTGGLFGGATIVDVAAGTSLSYNPEAIDGFYLLNNANLHTRPGSTFPTLAQAQTSLGEADSIIFDNGALITLDFNTGVADAVSSIFMHDNIYNEYNTVAGFSASEWVVTFPTKRLHIEQATAAARLPFANDSDDSITGTDNLQFDQSGYCEPIAVTYFDREEQETGVAPGDVDFSPEPPLTTPPGTNLCWEANVLTWNQSATVASGSSVLGSRFANNIDLVDIDGSVFSEGWIALGIGNANNYLLDRGASGNAANDGSEARNQLFGLPVVGFWAANFVNGNVDGALANYSIISKHRASRDSTSVTVNAGVITDTGNPAS